MKFEEWFDNEYPDDILCFSPNIPLRAQWMQLCRKAWEAAWEDGRHAGVSAQVEWQDYLDRCDD
jgi:hypothetical protein